MPQCYSENIELNTYIGIWKISESESELADGLELSKEALTRLSQRRSIIHRKGYLAIRKLLKSHGIDIARRTVTKYRDALKIPSSVQRRRQKSL